MKQIVIAVIILGIILFLSGRLVKVSNLLEEQENNVQVMSDTLTVLKDKEGQYQAKISSFESQELSQFLKLESKDKDIIKLKEEVKKAKKNLKNRGSVTVLTTDTKIDTVFKTRIEYLDSLVVYTSEVDLDGWITGLVKSDINYAHLNLKIKNEYSVVVGEEKEGLFKKPTPFVLVTNHNPYTETTSLRSYQVKVPKPKKFYVGPFIGVDYSLRPTIGIGVGYGLIRF